jgi:ABC-type lipoprotein export system ATPase subunit
VNGTDSVIVQVVDVSRAVRSAAGTTVLLAPTSVVLRAGTLVVLAGPSGSGKTTLCNIIIGWEPSDTGSVEWTDSNARGWAQLAVAPQRLALLPSIDLYENLALPHWSQRREVPHDDLAALAGQLQIDTLLARRPADVSFGEQQRAAVARALLGSPRLAVLDEPTGHQDEARAALVVEALLDARRRGTCVLVATHDADVIGAADMVVELHAAADAGGDDRARPYPTS